MAQAITRWPEAQVIASDSRSLRLRAGGFGIFGHGNAPLLAGASFDARKARQPCHARQCAGL
jgi:TPP-dependent trihydroxycyclohexane-1,2-dione (THcHDO) dehydratase